MPPNPRPFGVLLFLAVFLAACSRADVEPRRIAMPMTCGKAQFDAGIEELETIAIRRDEILGRADGYPVSEPVEYLRLVARDEAELKGLAERAGKVFLPRCLRAAQVIYENYMDKSRIALEARRPSDEPSTYRQKRETADTVYGQFKAEVAQQKRNVQ